MSCKNLNTLFLTHKMYIGKSMINGTYLNSSLPRPKKKTLEKSRWKKSKVSLFDHFDWIDLIKNLFEHSENTAWSVVAVDVIKLLKRDQINCVENFLSTSCICEKCIGLVCPLFSFKSWHIHQASYLIRYLPCKN